MISFVAVMISAKALGRIQLKGSLGGLHGGDVPGAEGPGEQGDHSHVENPGAESPLGGRAGKRVWVGRKPGAVWQVCLWSMEISVEQDQIGGWSRWEVEW